LPPDASDAANAAPPAVLIRHRRERTGSLHKRDGGFDAGLHRIPEDRTAADARVADSEDQTDAASHRPSTMIHPAAPASSRPIIVPEPTPLVIAILTASYAPGGFDVTAFHSLGIGVGPLDCARVGVPSRTQAAASMVVLLMVKFPVERAAARAAPSAPS
jgi:hypothetical protein